MTSVLVDVACPEGLEGSEPLGAPAASQVLPDRAGFGGGPLGMGSITGSALSGFGFGNYGLNGALGGRASIEGQARPASLPGEVPPEDERE